MDKTSRSLPSPISQSLENGYSASSRMSPTQSTNRSSFYGPERGGSVSLGGPRSRSGSVKSSAASHALTNDIVHFQPSSVINFPKTSLVNPTGASSSTHAGGIQPAISFFRPSRPSQYNLRPPSIASDTHSLARTSFTDERDRQVGASTRTQVSRDPLLPFANNSLSRNSSSTHQKTTNTRSNGNNSSSNGPAGRVRDSLERFFKRTTSLDLNTKEKRSNDSKTASHLPSEARSPTQLENAVPCNFQNEKAHLQFNPAPSMNATHIPLKDSKSGKEIRKWQLHASQNTFFLQGRILTGGDTPLPFIASLIAVFGIAGLWLGTTSVWWWHNESPAVAIVGAYMILVTTSSMFVTAFRDPGILPRGLDPDPPFPPDSDSLDGPRVPYPRDLQVRAGVVRVKYCSTCQIYRPPRSSHCRICDNCVDGCDHHCQWVNNCVGRRNYTSFITFLLATVLTLCLFICTSALQIFLQTRINEIDIRESLSEGAGSAVVFALCIVVLWPVGGLLGYHIRLLSLNMTTVEQIRYTAHRSLGATPPPPNPFAFSHWHRNITEILCRPQGISWLDAAGLATEDKRELNPGVVVQNAQQNDVENSKELNDPIQ